MMIENRDFSQLTNRAAALLPTISKRAGGEQDDAVAVDLEEKIGADERDGQEARRLDHCPAPKARKIPRMILPAYERSPGPRARVADGMAAYRHHILRSRGGRFQLLIANSGRLTRHQNTYGDA
jgi:hypothetical protein